MPASITNPEQQVNTYAVNFQINSDEYPDSVSTITIYKNNDPLYTFTTTAGGTPVTYTFAEPTSASVIYSVGGVANSESYEDYQIVSIEIFTVDEYKPTFTLPVIQCAKKGEPFSFFPTAWNMNSNVCPNTPLDSQVTYERYEFNMNTSQYELQGDPVVIDMTGEDGAVIGSDYAYVPNAEPSWIPDKLTMVKFIVKVQNCSTEIEKSTVFPICGGWKIRRIACGNYRIYNYTENPITFSFTYPSTEETALPDKTIIAFNYDTLVIDKDAIIKVTDDTTDSISQYIFNFCALESCILDLQKRILLDCNLCDDCKMDKVLYQKALRLLSVYETWKKLLDKDWVYNIQYQSTDIDNELSRIYDAEELYKELIKFCDECSASSKNCGCGC
jgi:hypothetical protein